MSMLKPDYIDIDNDGNTTEPMRDQYVIGGIVKAITKIAKKFKGKKDIHTPEFKKYMREKLEKEFPDLSKKELDAIMKDLNKPMGEGFPFEEYAELSKMPKDIKVFKNEGGPMSMDDQMKAALVIPMESEMESDDDMEDGYTRFIMEEALSEEEEEMLMSKLEQDEELSMLFDKVIDVAQEFAGSGPVEGPGSGVSDSIPARLSDGEFVFTAKATEQIGADELMRMMKDAEAAADERQGLAEGGVSEEEESQSLLGSGIMQEDEIAEDELKKRMVQGSSDYVRS